jgi:hypothetical protein
MDENTNDSNQSPGLVTPDNSSVTPETPPSVTAGSPPEPAAGTATTTPVTSQSTNDVKASSETAPTSAATEKSPEGTPVSAAAADGAPSATVPAAGGDTAAAANPKPIPPSNPNKKSLQKILFVVIVVVLLAGIAIVVALAMGTKKTSVTITSTAKTTATVSTAKTNIWTGKGNTDEWNTASNWSLGVPVNGQSLTFNVSLIAKPSAKAVATFQNNIPNLTINKLFINGTGVGFVLKGNPLTITDGISQAITLASKTASPAQVTIETPITFSADQSVQVAANNTLTFDGMTTPATTTIGANTVQFSAAKSGDIELYTPIEGTGEIEIPSSTTTPGNVDFNTASPDFKGNVMVNSGATVGLGNQDTAGSGVSSTDAFGTSSVTIASGAYLELNEVGSDTYTVPNDITVGGNGEASASKNNGAFTGAVSTCITKAQQGCSDGATVTFTGTVTLTSDTQFGAFYGLSSPQVSPSTTVTYITKDLVANGHALAAIASSKAVIQKS